MPRLNYLSFLDVFGTEEQLNYSKHVINLTDKLVTEGHVLVKETPFILSSGKKSRIYINMKSAVSNIDILEMIDEMFGILFEVLWGNRKGYPQKVALFSYLAGGVLGGVPIASVLSYQHIIPLLCVRKESKDHGTSKLVEGDTSTDPYGPVLLIEDVVTTGDSSRGFFRSIRKEMPNAKIWGVFTVIDRRAEEEVKRWDEEFPNTPIVSLATLEDICTQNSLMEHLNE